MVIICAGAKIESDTENIFAKSDIILKIKEPLFSGIKNIHEVDTFKKGQYLITFFIFILRKELLLIWYNLNLDWGFPFQVILKVYTDYMTLFGINKIKFFIRLGYFARL